MELPAAALPVVTVRPGQGSGPRTRTRSPELRGSLGDSGLRTSGGPRDSVAGAAGLTPLSNTRPGPRRGAAAAVRVAESTVTSRTVAGPRASSSKFRLAGGPAAAAVAAGMIHAMMLRIQVDRIGLAGLGAPKFTGKSRLAQWKRRLFKCRARESE